MILLLYLLSAGITGMNHLALPSYIVLSCLFKFALMAFVYSLSLEARPFDL
jgi:hypothetical protein